MRHQRRHEEDEEEEDTDETRQLGVGKVFDGVFVSFPGEDAWSVSLFG